MSVTVPLSDLSPVIRYLEELGYPIKLMHCYCDVRMEALAIRMMAGLFNFNLEQIFFLKKYNWWVQPTDQSDKDITVGVVMYYLPNEREL